MLKKSPPWLVSKSRGEKSEVPWKEKRILSGCEIIRHKKRGDLL